MADILVLCAHNDDQVIGAGGALLKYAKEGKTFKTIVFSYGEFHPYLKTRVISKIREKEGIKSDKILKGSGILKSSLISSLQSDILKAAYNAIS